MKGIPKAYAQEVVHDVTEDISGVEESFGEVFIRVSPFIDITIETIKKLEGQNA